MSTTAIRQPTPRCPCHWSREPWRDEPDKSRPGWIRTSCQICGRFVGFRPDKRATVIRDEPNKPDESNEPLLVEAAT
jgi:hypothetical protein